MVKAFPSQKEEWEATLIGNILTLYNGRAYKLSEWEKEGTPVIRIQNLSGGKDYYYSNLKLPEHQYVDKGELLYAWSGHFGSYVWNGDRSIYHYHIWKVIPKKGVSKQFVYFYLDWITETIKQHDKRGGLGLFHLTKSGIEKFKVFIPSFYEQKKIAAILSSVDRVIETTQDAIAQLQIVKRGLMQQLLTKDIERKSKLWKKAILNEIIETLDSGISISADNRSKNDGEYGILKLSAVSDGKFLSFENKAVNTSDITQLKINPKKDKILISRSNTELLVGECGYVDRDYPDLFLPDLLWQIEPKKEAPIHMKWLLYFLIYQKHLGSINRIATGTSSSMRKISKRNFLKLKISFPPLLEQKEIADILTSIDKRIESEEAKKAQVEIIKKGLMQQLLTGKMRVKV